MVSLLFGVALLATACRTLLLSPAEELNFTTVQSWTYQLRNVDLRALERSPYDLLIIDESKDGTEEGRWSGMDIRRVRAAGKGKILLAYVSLGELETNRWYWNSSWATASPSWIGKEISSGGTGARRFKVKYWDPSWKEIVKQSIERIRVQGFNGVLLDGCDEHAYWSNPQNGEWEVLFPAEAANRMVDLIAWLSEEVRSRTPEFVLCAQESGGLLSTSTRGASYVKALQGVVGVGIFFPGTAPVDNPFAPLPEKVSYFSDLRSQGVRVFSLEYLSPLNASALSLHQQEAKKYGFLPYAAHRELDTLGVP